MGKIAFGGRFGYIFFFFGSGRGKGESEAPGGGLGFLLQIPGGAGEGRERPSGREGVCGELGNFWGGEVNIFLGGRNVHQVN